MDSNCTSSPDRNALLIKFHNALVAFQFICRLYDKELNLVLSIKQKSLESMIGKFLKSWDCLVDAGTGFFKILPSESEDDMLYRAENLFQYRLALDEGKMVYRSLRHLQEFFNRRAAKGFNCIGINSSNHRYPTFIRFDDTRREVVFDEQ